MIGTTTLLQNTFIKEEYVKCDYIPKINCVHLLKKSMLICVIFIYIYNNILFFVCF